MARGRVYTVGFNNVTLSAVQDVLAIYAGASMAFEVHFVKLGQVTQTTIGGARLRLRHLPATVTTGSGGTSQVLAAALPNDASATVTARANDTTQATTSGTAKDMPDVWDLPFGYLWMPPEADRIVIKPSEAFVVSLDTALSSVIANGHMAIAELF